MLTHAIFVAAFTSLVAYYYPQIVEDVLYRNSFENKHKHLLLKEYDFIIIGAGSAGSVLARRLVLAADWKVLLLEAGGEETHESRTPLFHFFQHHTSLDWNYTTVAQKNACLNTEGICYYPRGHGMGGSSSINGLMYVRGNKDDYDGWAGSDPTASHWSYQNVKQYFKRLERVSLGDREVSSDRGTDGLLTVQHAKYQSKLALDLIKAGEELGVKSKDYNGPEQISFSIPQLTVDGPRRKSVASAYIDSLYTDFKYYDKIVNLDIIRGAFVNKITINDETKTAQSVQFTYDNQKYELKANKEILLSAGVINTPKILMLSGVGPKEQLDKFSIETIADLPVGEYLQDHVQVFIPFKINGNETITSYNYMTRETIEEYAIKRQGSLATNAIIVLGFINTTNIDFDPPDISYHIVNFELKKADRSYITISVGLLTPESRGWVRLASADPTKPPLINPNYLNVDNDLNKFIEGIKKAELLMKTTVLEKYEPKIMHEELSLCDDTTSYDYYKCLVNKYASTQYHPVGTARMGSYPMNSVVNWNLQVHGINKLRVVDASVMPTIPRGNTNAPTVMVAEQASDIIIKYWKNKEL